MSNADFTFAGPVNFEVVAGHGTAIAMANMDMAHNPLQSKDVNAQSGPSSSPNLGGGGKGAEIG